MSWEAPEGAPPAYGGRPRLNPSGPTGVPRGDEGAPPTEVGAEEAYDAFLRERYPRLVSTVRAIVGDHAIAEDVVQETFARAYLNWSKLWPEGNPGGWVHRVATNLAISWRRRMARELKAVTRLGRRSTLESPAPEAYPELHEAVAHLPLRQRTAVALHYILGLPVADAAEAMGCATGTVKSLLFQARARLRDELGEDEA